MPFEPDSLRARVMRPLDHDLQAAFGPVDAAVMIHSNHLLRRALVGCLLATLVGACGGTDGSRTAAKVLRDSPVNFHASQPSSPSVGPFGVESTALGGLDDATRPTVNWRPESWVGDIYLRHNFATASGHDSGMPASSVTLGQIAIPGSHDSAAYRTGDFAGPCNDLSDLAKKFGKPMTERWAKTQHHDLYEQAMLGVRSFDLRPYYDGSIIRTCHTLDTATLDQAIGGHSGLNRFIAEHPEEPVILNLSHYMTVGAKNSDEWRRGLDNLIDYLKNNVCDHALGTTLKARGPGGLWTTVPALMTVGEMNRLKRNYVVMADDGNDLYHYLSTHGLDRCVFKAASNSSNAYAFPDRSENVAGRTVSLNLWDALLRAYVFGDQAIGRSAVLATRSALQQFLIRSIAGRGKAKLHDTNYIWSYETPNIGKVKDIFPSVPFVGDEDLGPFAVLVLKQKYDDGLIQMTDRTSVDWTSNWPVPFSRGSVAVGLFDGGADFVQRLDQAARDAGTNVNVVSMDAIGTSPGTRSGFIDPLMALNTRMVW